MNDHTAHLNLAWSRLLVEELRRTGVTYVAMAPGARSSPVALAVAGAEGVTYHVVLDERAAAFHALGYARATGRPAAVVTTSGTAAANLWPAVVESDRSGIPLLLLTADRPPELRDTGAHQTIHQAGLFGRYARWACDVPCPDARIDPGFALSTVDHAVRCASAAPAGPVHLNLMFREPLVPGLEDAGETELPARFDAWCAGADPRTVHVEPLRELSADAHEALAGIRRHTCRGLVVVGALPAGVDRAAVAALLDTLGWPVCADVTSGLRLGNRSPLLIAHHDLVLLDAERLGGPDTVLHLGGPFVSKRLARYLAAAAPRQYVQVQNQVARQDPDAMATLRIEAAPDALCRGWPHVPHDAEDASWTPAWQAGEAAVRRVLRERDAAVAGLDEPSIARLVAGLLPEGHDLVLGNSMPVRDMNVFADPGCAAPAVACNRGASGIDGTLASATGFARGREAPVTVVLGDLAFHHDLNALDLVRRSPFPVTAVVINNDGGGIFSFLPLVEHQSLFEPCFGTPHGLCFEAAATLYGLAYVRPQSREEFVGAFQAASDAGTSTVVEIDSSRAENVEIHRQIEADVRAQLARIQP